jgi:hypothetical protein
MCRYAFFLGWLSVVQTSRLRPTPRVRNTKNLSRAEEFLRFARARTPEFFDRERLRPP